MRKCSLVTVTTANDEEFVYTDVTVSYGDSIVTIGQKGKTIAMFGNPDSVLIEYEEEENVGS